jgi:hypothetical protein
MEDALTQLLVILFAVVLLPLVPAVLLFKFLPSDASAEGPWKGLKIKVGGSFAGYFLMVVLLTGISRHYVAPPPTQDFYQISAILVPEDPSVRLDHHEFEFYPELEPQYAPTRDGAYRFRARVPVPVNARGEPIWLIDAWQISHPDIFPETIRLSAARPLEDSTGRHEKELVAEDVVLYLIGRDEE